MKQMLAVVVIGLFTHSALAWDECKTSREFEQVLDIKTAELLEVEAGAGSLEIKGSDRSDIAIHATLCSEDDELLAQMQVASDIKPDAVHIKTAFPKDGWLNQTQMKIDLVLSVPRTMALRVADSSGSATVKNVASLNMKDSSGELLIKNIAGDMSVIDSSGELKISNVGGNANVTDSSGDLIVADVKGNFTIDADSSGDIDIKRVGENVLIRRDSSGSIAVDDVGGDFTVQADGSGGISYDKIAGNVSLPK